MIIASDFTRMFKLEEHEPLSVYHSQQKTEPETVGDAVAPVFVVHNLNEIETWGNHIVVEQVNMIGGYNIIHKGYYSSPVHLKKVLEELGVIV